MTAQGERRNQRPFATPTEDLLSRWLREPNPVTRSVLAQIIGRRIDRLHQQSGDAK